MKDQNLCTPNRKEVIWHVIEGVEVGVVVVVVVVEDMFHCIQKESVVDCENDFRRANALH